MELHSYHISYRLALKDGTSGYGSNTLTMAEPMKPKLLKEARDDLYKQLSEAYPDAVDLTIIAFTKFEVPM